MDVGNVVQELFGQDFIEAGYTFRLTMGDSSWHTYTGPIKDRWRF